MKDNNEHENNTAYRTHARTANILCTGKESEMENDEVVELMLDEIYTGINQRILEIKKQLDLGVKVNDEEMFIVLEFDPVSKFEVREEVISRLEDYNYDVQLLADSQDEVDLLTELEEMAMTDETILKQLNEFKEGILDFKISWDKAFDTSEE